MVRWQVWVAWQKLHWRLNCLLGRDAPMVFPLEKPLTGLNSHSYESVKSQKDFFSREIPFQTLGFLWVCSSCCYKIVLQWSFEKELNLHQGVADVWLPHRTSHPQRPSLWAEQLLEESLLAIPPGSTGLSASLYDYSCIGLQISKQNSGGMW